MMRQICNLNILVFFNDAKAIAKILNQLKSADVSLGFGA